MSGGCNAVNELGGGGVILFGTPETEDEQAAPAYADRGVVQEAVRAIKGEIKDVLVITNVCSCEHTSHGHCGLVRGHQILNDATIDLLSPSGPDAGAARALKPF